MSKRRTTANDGYLKCHEDDSCECKLLALIFILVCVASAFLHSTILEGGFAILGRNCRRLNIVFDLEIHQCVTSQVFSGRGLAM